MRTQSVLRGSVMALVGLAAGYAAILRPRHLEWGASAAELARRWPGDELVPAPFSRAVRAVTIQAPAADVWPWIMQVGRDRGGFYSYTVLENLIGADIHNLEGIIPALPDRRPGDTVWMGPPEKFGGEARMVVHAVAPGYAMVLLSPDDAARAGRGEPVQHGAWSFVVEPTSERAARLIMVSLTARLRAVDLVFWEPAHFVMERKMMLTIKRLAERG
jgi:hypothetical protein